MDAVTIAEHQREGGGAPSQRRPVRAGRAVTGAGGRLQAARMAVGRARPIRVAVADQSCLNRSRTAMSPGRRSFVASTASRTRSTPRSDPQDRSVILGTPLGSPTMRWRTSARRWSASGQTRRVVPQTQHDDRWAPVRRRRESPPKASMPLQSRARAHTYRGPTPRRARLSIE